MGACGTQTAALASAGNTSALDVPTTASEEYNAVHQYENASEEQKKWMDKNADYILSKIKTLEKKYAYFKF